DDEAAVAVPLGPRHQLLLGLPLAPAVVVERVGRCFLGGAGGIEAIHRHGAGEDDPLNAASLRDGNDVLRSTYVHLVIERHRLHIVGMLGREQVHRLHVVECVGEAVTVPNIDPVGVRLLFGGGFINHDRASQVGQQPPADEPGTADHCRSLQWNRRLSWTSGGWWEYCSRRKTRAAQDPAETDDKPMNRKKSATTRRRSSPIVTLAQHSKSMSIGMLGTSVLSMQQFRHAWCDIWSPRTSRSRVLLAISGDPQLCLSVPVPARRTRSLEGGLF